MYGKKKNNQKRRTKILIVVIPAILAGITAICTAFINLNQKTMNFEEHGSTKSETKEIESKNNSGAIVNGDDNIVNVLGNEEDTKKKEEVSLTGEMISFATVSVDNERINMYYGDGYEPIFDFHLINENEITIDIKNIFMEVLDYKNFNDFVAENPAGGADLLDIIYWRCNINSEKKRYRSILIGTDENNTEDLSTTQYVSIKSSDSGKFYLKVFPDTPGLYEAKVIIEYTSYEGKVKEIVSDNMKFIYDPQSEVHYKAE